MAHAGPALLAILLLVGCDHAGPFTVSSPAEDGPFAPGAVARLTFGSGISPAGWLPSSDTLVLAARDEDRSEGDICLFLLPASGGTRGGGLCSPTFNQADSVELFGAPVVSSSRTVAFTYKHRRQGGSTFGSIRSGPLSVPFAPVELSSLPFSMGGRLIQDASDLGWVTDDDLSFLAWTDEVVERDCPAGPCDVLLRIPLGGMRVSQGGGGVTPIAGTWLATSVTPDGNGGLFATFPGSDQLWRVSASGDSAAVHDFGPASGVRGADHKAGRVAVIVAGDAMAEADDLGLISTSSGFGELVVLDLASGTTTRVGPLDMIFRDPALSPDGRKVVAIGTHFTTTRQPSSSLVDTVLARPQGDLWRISLP